MSVSTLCRGEHVIRQGLVLDEPEAAQLLARANRNVGANRIPSNPKETPNEFAKRVVGYALYAYVDGRSTYIGDIASGMHHPASDTMEFTVRVHKTILFDSQSTLVYVTREEHVRCQRDANA